MEVVDIQVVTKDMEVTVIVHLEVAMKILDTEDTVVVEEDTESTKWTKAMM